MFASAAVGGCSWDDSLRSLAEATGSSRGQLIGFGNVDAVRFNWINDFQPEDNAAFEAHGFAPTQNARVAVASYDQPLTVRWERDYDAVISTYSNDAYRDLIYHYDIPYGCQTKVVETEGSVVGLAVLRTQRDGRTRARDRAIFAAAMPHIRSAVRTQIALEHQGDALVAGAMDEVDAAVFMCRADGFVETMTTAAERIVMQGTMRIVGGRLQACEPRDNATLLASIACHSAIAGRPMDTIVLGRGRPGGLPTLIDLCAAIGGRLRVQPLVMVIVRTGRRWHQAAVAILREFYGLSAAEADVVLHLASGEARTAIAEARGASVETVRAQLKSAFAKLGVGREVEVVAMLSSLLRM